MKTLQVCLQPLHHSFFFHPFPSSSSSPRSERATFPVLGLMLLRHLWAEKESDNSAYDITSGVHMNAHEDAFSAPRTNVRLVAVFGAFKVPRVHSCALHLHYPLGYYRELSSVIKRRLSEHTFKPCVTVSPLLYSDLA